MGFTSLSGEQRLDLGPVKKVMGSILAILFCFFSAKTVERSIVPIDKKKSSE